MFLVRISTKKKKKKKVGGRFFVVSSDFFTLANWILWLQIITLSQG